MRVKVIGVVVLLACLLSVAKADASDDTDQSDKDNKLINDNSKDSEPNKIQDVPDGLNKDGVDVTTVNPVEPLDRSQDSTLQSVGDTVHATESIRPEDPTLTTNPVITKEQTNTVPQQDINRQNSVEQQNVQPLVSPQIRLKQNSPYNQQNPQIKTSQMRYPLPQAYPSRLENSASERQHPDTALTAAELMRNPDLTGTVNKSPALYKSDVPKSLQALLAQQQIKSPQQTAQLNPRFVAEYPPGQVTKYYTPLIQDHYSITQSPTLNNIPQHLTATKANPYNSKAPYGTRRESAQKDDVGRDGQYSEYKNSYPYNPEANKSQESRTGSYALNSYAQAQSSSNMNQGLNPYSYGYPPGPSNIGNMASASAIAQTSQGMASAHSSANLLQGAKSRVILPHEYIFPHKMLGGETALQCTKENEVHTLWSIDLDCLLCICLNEYGILAPVCFSCAGCQTPAPPEPVPYITVPPTPPNLPIPLPEPIVPTPIESFNQIESDVIVTPKPPRERPSCSPLPRGQPFPHPLQPCQVCICKEVIVAFGKIDVRIDCHDSPQCVLPTDVTTIPPLPDVPIPIPLPLCEKFPPNVIFPHPTDKCKQCRCTIEMSVTGIPEPQITCFNEDNCVTPPALPIPVPVEHYPTRPNLLPDNVVEPGTDLISTMPPSIVTPRHPLPWPPIQTTPRPPLPVSVGHRKGPLPGPSPHDSCRPYPPNQPFQHPWDECQVCECSELNTMGLVNIEVNCYTKISCCIEAPDLISAYAGKSISEKNRRLLNPGAATEFASASANAVSQPINPFNGIQSNTLRPYETDVLVPGSVEANAIAQSSVNSQSSQWPGYKQTGSISSAVANSQSNQGFAEANAIAQYGGNNQNSLWPGIPTSESPIFNPGIPNSGYSEASASSQSVINNPNYKRPVSYQPYNTMSSAVAGTSLAEISEYKPQKGGVFSPYNQGYADANAIALNSVNNAPGSYVNAYSSATNDGSQSFAESNAGFSQGQDNLDGNTQYYRPVSSTLRPSPLYVQYNPEIQSNTNQAYADANAQYIANTQKPLIFQNSPGITQNQAIAQANAQYNGITSTFNTPSLNGQYDQNIYQNLPNVKLNSLYNNDISNNQVSGLYGSSAEANAMSQNYLSGYPGSYQGANAQSKVTGDQVSSIAQAQTQDYPSLNPYLSNYLYFNPYSTVKSDQVSNDYPLKYSGSYEFNGQPETVSVLNPRINYYSPGISPYNNMYPKYSQQDRSYYDTNPVYGLGQYGGTSGQNIGQAEAYAASKSLAKSGYPDE